MPTLSRHFGTVAEVSIRQLGSSVRVSRQLSSAAELPVVVSADTVIIIGRYRLSADYQCISKENAGIFSLIHMC